MCSVSAVEGLYFLSKLPGATDIWERAMYTHVAGMRELLLTNGKVCLAPIVFAVEFAQHRGSTGSLMPKVLVAPLSSVRNAPVCVKFDSPDNPNTHTLIAVPTSFFFPLCAYFSRF